VPGRGAAGSGEESQDLDHQETVEQTVGGAEAEEQLPTGLGSGVGSGLGHSPTSEPERLLGGEDEAR